MHVEFLDLLSSGIQKRAARIAAAIPNGYGKSTMASFALPIWAVIRRCVEQIVVNRNEGQCRITLRRIPTIAGDSLVLATHEVAIQFSAG